VRGRDEAVELFTVRAAPISMALEATPLAP
jgi:hypothetical protein